MKCTGNDAEDLRSIASELIGVAVELNRGAEELRIADGKRNGIAVTCFEKASLGKQERRNRSEKHCAGFAQIGMGIAQN